MTFFFKTTTEYFIQLALFTCTFHRWILLTGEEICWICLNFTWLAQFFGVHPRAISRWLTDQSELALYVCYVLKNIKQNIAQRSFVHVWKLFLRCPFYLFSLIYSWQFLGPMISQDCLPGLRQLRPLYFSALDTLRIESPSIFLDKSGRGNLILSKLQIQTFLRRQSNRYRTIHCVCQIKAAI